MKAIVRPDEREGGSGGENLQIRGRQKELVFVLAVKFAAGVERDNLNAPLGRLRIFLREDGVEIFRQLLLRAIAAVPRGAQRAGEQNQRELTNRG